MSHFHSILKKMKTNPDFDSIAIGKFYAQSIELKIQNIIDYYWHGTDEKFEFITDFPCIVPPWPNIWLEWEHPNRIRLKGKLHEIKGDRLGKFAVLVLTQEDPKSSLIPEAKWRTEFHCFYPYQRFPFIGSFQYFIDEKGNGIVKQIQAEGDEVKYYLPRQLSPDYIPYASTQGLSPAEFMQHMEAAFVWPIWLAFSFCHCKNITLKEHAPNKKESAHHRRLHGMPLTKYYTLEIDPMKKILQSEGNIEANGLKKALHICRGHFAEYGPDFGKGKLFGKHEGRFWIPQHMKGSSEQGIIHKDYSVNAPEVAAT